MEGSYIEREETCTKDAFSDSGRASDVVNLVGVVYVGWGRLFVVEHGMCVEEVLLVKKVRPFTGVVFFFVCVN